MADYQTIDAARILRRADHATIPRDPANRDYRRFLAWEAAGGVIDPVAPVSPRKYDDQVHVREVQTTNATPLAVNLPLNAGTLYVSTLTVVGVQETSPFHSATFTKRATVGRAGGGAVLVGQEDLHTPFKTAGASAWTAVLTVSGNNAVMTVTGGAVPITWTIRSEYFRVNKDGLVD